MLKIVAGDQRDITNSRNLYRKLGHPKSRLVRWLKSAVRDLHEVIDDHLSGIRYRGLLAAAPCNFLYERMTPFRSVGLNLARHFGLPWILEVNDPLYETLRFTLHHSGVMHCGWRNVCSKRPQALSSDPSD